MFLYYIKINDYFRTIDIINLLKLKKSEFMNEINKYDNIKLINVFIKNKNNNNFIKIETFLKLFNIYLNSNSSILKFIYCNKEYSNLLFFLKSEILSIDQFNLIQNELIKHCIHTLPNTRHFFVNENDTIKFIEDLNIKNHKISIYNI